PPTGWRCFQGHYDLGRTTAVAPPGPTVFRHICPGGDNPPGQRCPWDYESPYRQPFPGGLGWRYGESRGPWGSLHCP
ncbi:hypothetical protein NDU88_007455, partial [Pleurodeles waltl]